LPADKITIDRDYQRDLRGSWVRRLASDFDPDKFGALEVSRRIDGTLVVLNGQHRLAAVEALGWTEQTVPCLVYENLSPSEEASVFVGLNLHLRLTGIDNYRAALHAEEPWATTIHKIIEVLGGWKIAGGGGTGTIQAVAALRYAYDFDALAKVADICGRAWPEGNWHAPIIQALTIVVTENAGKVKPERMADRLKVVGPNEIKRRASDKSKWDNYKVSRSMVDVLIALYNRGLRSNKLPPFKPRRSIGRPYMAQARGGSSKRSKPTSSKR
jgi:hypothetical protein